MTGKSFLLDGDHAASLRISACGFKTIEDANQNAKIILDALTNIESMQQFAETHPNFSLQTQIKIPQYYEGYMMSK